MMQMPEAYEDDIDRVAKAMLAFAMEHCRRKDGNFDSLLFGMAAAQFTGANLSLLDGATARDALMLVNDRLGGSYLAGKRIGETH